MDSREKPGKETERAEKKHTLHPPLPKTPPFSLKAFQGEGQLATFGERATYTFVYGQEVGSIHFDRMRGEIFFKGHNILHMDLEPWEMQMVEKMRLVLQNHSKTRHLAESYGKTLDKIILTKAHRSSP